MHPRGRGGTNSGASMERPPRGKRVAYSSPRTSGYLSGLSTEAPDGLARLPPTLFPDAGFVECLGTPLGAPHPLRGWNTVTAWRGLARRAPGPRAHACHFSFVAILALSPSCWPCDRACAFGVSCASGRESGSPGGPPGRTAAGNTIGAEFPGPARQRQRQAPLLISRGRERCQTPVGGNRGQATQSGGVGRGLDLRLKRRSFSPGRSGSAARASPRRPIITA